MTRPFDELIRDLERIETEEDRRDRELDLRRHSEREISISEAIESKEWSK